MKNIFEEFPAPSHQKWLELVEKELKRPLEPLEIADSLFSDPFLDQEFLEKSTLTKSKEGWVIFQKIDITDDLQSANREILEAVNGGANGLRLVVLTENYDFKEIFKDVDLSKLSLSIESPSDTFKVLKTLDEYCSDSHQNNTPMEIITHNQNENYKSLKPQLLISESSEKPLFQNLSEILSEAENIGIQKGKPFWIKLNSSENFFLNIAKIRALKILWEHILEANGADKPEMKVWVNIKNTNPDANQAAIAATQQAAAAISGTADAIEIDTLDYSSDHPKGFPERITRNIQNLLWFESHLNKVDDPSAGSYFIEDLTEKIKNEIWNLFLKNR